MNLRRFSKMVLAGYGGASLLFFGISPLVASASARVKPPTDSNEKEAEEAQLEKAINDSEAEMEGTSAALPEDNREYSWWDVLLGKHDKEIFERSVHGDTRNVTRMRATAVIGVERQMPRFWVLTDHDRCQVVLVLRGMYISFKWQMTRTLDDSYENRYNVSKRVGSRLDVRARRIRTRV